MVVRATSPRRALQGQEGSLPSLSCPPNNQPPPAATAATVTAAEDARRVEGWPDRSSWGSRHLHRRRHRQQLRWRCRRWSSPRRRHCCPRARPSPRASPRCSSRRPKCPAAPWSRPGTAPRHCAKAPTSHSARRGGWRRRRRRAAGHPDHREAERGRAGPRPGTEQSRPSEPLPACAARTGVTGAAASGRQWARVRRLPPPPSRDIML